MNELSQPTQSLYSASYEKVDSLATKVLMALEDVKVGDAVMGTSLALARLISPDQLKPEVEIKFVQDILDWSSVYLGSAENAN